MTGLMNLLKQVDKEHIYFESLDNEAHSVDCRKYGLTIIINRNMENSEQIVCILHELLHWTDKFYRKSNGSLNRDPAIENEIDELAYWIFRHRPRIVEYIRRNLYE